jgi:hypothetical protein
MLVYQRVASNMRTTESFEQATWNGDLFYDVSKLDDMRLSCFVSNWVDPNWWSLGKERFHCGKRFWTKLYHICVWGKVERHGNGDRTNTMQLNQPIPVHVWQTRTYIYIMYNIYICIIYIKCIYLIVFIYMAQITLIQPSFFFCAWLTATASLRLGYLAFRPVLPKC